MVFTRFSRREHEYAVNLKLADGSFNLSFLGPRSFNVGDVFSDCGIGVV